MALDGSVTLSPLSVSAAELTGEVSVSTVVVPLRFTVNAVGDSWDTFSDGDEFNLYLGYVAVDGTLSPGALCQGDSFFPELASAGSLEPPLAWSGEWGLDGAGYAGGVGNGHVVVGTTLAVRGGIDDPKLFPEFAVDAVGQSAALITGAATFPAWTGAGSLAPALVLPELAAAGTLLGGTLADASIAVPALVVAATVGTYGDAQLPPLSVAAHGVAGSAATGAALLPRWEVAATHAQDTFAHASVTLRVLAADARGEPGSRIAAMVSFVRPHLDAAAVAGRVGTATATVPLLRVAAHGHANPIGTAWVELPMLLLDGRASGPTVLPSLTIAVNTQLAAVTEYQALAANSFARFGDVTLAATTGGIVALAGDTDLGAPISAEVVAGVSDYGSDSVKRIIAGYVGYRANGDINLTLISDDYDEHVYQLVPRQSGNALHASRVKFGRGAEGRYWQWKLANQAGADFAVDTIGLDIEPLSKKIR
jgi:hypothetical protein